MLFELGNSREDGFVILRTETHSTVESKGEIVDFTIQPALQLVELAGDKYEEEAEEENREEDREKSQEMFQEKGYNRVKEDGRRLAEDRFSSRYLGIDGHVIARNDIAEEILIGTGVRVHGDAVQQGVRMGLELGLRRRDVHLQILASARWYKTILFTHLGIRHIEVNAGVLTRAVGVPQPNEGSDGERGAERVVRVVGDGGEPEAISDMGSEVEGMSSGGEGRGAIAKIAGVHRGGAKEGGGLHKSTAKGWW